MINRTPFMFTFVRSSSRWVAPGLSWASLPLVTTRRGSRRGLPPGAICFIPPATHVHNHLRGGATPSLSQWVFGAVPVLTTLAIVNLTMSSITGIALAREIHWALGTGGWWLVAGGCSSTY